MTSFLKDSLSKAPFWGRKEGRKEAPSCRERRSISRHERAWSPSSRVRIFRRLRSRAACARRAARRRRSRRRGEAARARRGPRGPGERPTACAVVDLPKTRSPASRARILWERRVPRSFFGTPAQSGLVERTNTEGLPVLCVCVIRIESRPRGPAGAPCAVYQATTRSFCVAARTSTQAT